ncbi:hypothetical protein AAJ76_200072272 [Vairimorpha ceranae]|uniref:Uncharacterized protein n=1 Tax=Vairimorpha ceranae TaxID=40302 RepID=A0A0F9WJ16_9MICR|nr:hypothetical protein AAJ76_200072272 [Vairimorpha ceranae]KKO76540.1 hypothetical protein AAJ76_200072272 [Vairimorpha ceranae]
MLQQKKQCEEILNMIRICIFARVCQKCGSKIVQYGISMVRCKDKFCKIRYSIFKHTAFFSLKISPSTFLKIIGLFLTIFHSSLFQELQIY